MAVVGAGPAGLAAAEVLLADGPPGLRVEVFDAMPSVGRKFLLAGKGGLNLTHAEPFEAFVGRYAERAPQIGPLLRSFDAEALRAWAAGLGVETFVGTSGRVFPRDMKAAPLLRAWLHRLRGQGAVFHMRHRWLGWDDDAPAPGGPPAPQGCGAGLRFDTPAGALRVQPGATLLALGGASWPRLGSDGAWWPWLAARGVALAPLRPANCGFDVGWSAHFADRFAGHPLKSVAIAFEGRRQVGECVVTAGGLEGSLVYALSAALRERIVRDGSATFHLDLLPGRDPAWVAREVAHPRGPRSLSTHLKTRLRIDGAKAGLLHELLPREAMADPARLAAALQALPVTLRAPRPVAEAISTAGGVRFEALDDAAMLRALPGVFVAGEMLDWEAPTGGYLLNACFATGRHAARGALRWLAAQPAGRDGPCAPDGRRAVDGAAGSGGAGSGGRGVPGDTPGVGGDASGAGAPTGR